MKRPLLHPNRPSRWPRALTAFLHENEDAIAGWDEKPGRTSAQQYDQLHRLLRDILDGYDLKAWHCTRLTDAEIGDIARSGMHLPNAATLGNRIRILTETGMIAPEIALKLLSQNEADDCFRKGTLWFCPFPPHQDGEGGIDRFFRYWGGEALYVRHEQDPQTSPILRNIGTPVLIEVRLPVCITQTWSSLTWKIARRYLLSRGYPIEENMHHDACIDQPLPAQNVVRIIRFPEADFRKLTGCDRWIRKIQTAK